MNKKTSIWILMAVGAAVLGTGLALRFGLGNSAVSFEAAAICLVGLALALEYKDAQYRKLLLAFQALSILVIIAVVISWFVPLPRPAVVAILLCSIAVNLPLVALGLKRSEK